MYTSLLLLFKDTSFHRGKYIYKKNMKHPQRKVGLSLSASFYD